jgi:hypothetical protein
MKFVLQKTKSNSPTNVWAICAMFALPIISQAQSSYTINDTTADAFLASGSADNPEGADLTAVNFGGAGTLAIAPASSTKGAFDSVIRFNAAAAASQFNTTYGAGGWTITGVTLSLASNYGVQGVQPNNAVFNSINAGSFGIDWLANDSWVEGAGSGSGEPGYPTTSEVSFNSIPSLLASGYDSLGTYLYTPPGNNVYVNYSLPLDANLDAGAASGGDVNLYFYAADDEVSYLFNSRTYASNHPELTITVAAAPEPSVLTMSALGLVGLGGLSLFSNRRWKTNK